MKKVFLGGTCNDSTWRRQLISQLQIDYFDPVVDNWTPEAQKEEIRQRELCDFCLYVLTPLMTGVYSIAEVVDDSNKHPGKTIFCYLTVDGGVRFKEGQIKSLDAVGMLIVRNGGKWCKSLESTADLLNSYQ
ncbi:MAG: nucleoside 2-deoxyribosyltransferase domain-containing protein [Candidatus Latescibacteria bacterium]|jgi:hypothetical protein|nr:nucleoside 2-deoxyribosyltransferase domain-containing protein [Candidatus Latescibacterota bacterium]